MKEYIITSPPYNAATDGCTNDRAAIQNAIDDAYKNGGGTVVLPAGKDILTSGIVLRDNVCLHFEDGARLLQSDDFDSYVKPVSDGYEKYIPETGHNWSSEIKWSHLWYKNYPFIYAVEGSKNFSITGKGTIRMMEYTDEEHFFRNCPVGFFHANNFEISDITIENYHGYAMMPFSCNNGLFRNITIREANHGNGDGICLMNCQNIRITGCNMNTTDDSVYIFSSYRDPRRSEWWNSDEPQPSLNIEIDNNYLDSNCCKAFGMILWGTNCPDKELTEVRNVYVHDNHFVTMGNWLFNPYADYSIDPPVTDVRFENNIVDGYEVNFFETQVGNMYGYRSMKRSHNVEFKDGRCFWSYDNADKLTFIKGDNSRCEINGKARLYQGIYCEKNSLCAFFVKIEGNALIYVENENGEIIAKMPVDNELPENVLKFTTGNEGNYRVGIESLEGKTIVYRAELAGNSDLSYGYTDIFKDFRGHIIYK